MSKIHLIKIANKIKKAAKIIRNEGFPAFAGKLAGRVVYGMANTAAVLSSKGRRCRLARPAPENRFTEKKVVHNVKTAAERLQAQKLFKKIKADIMKEIRP
ncbi:MAG TPA: hypothetical protein PKM08_00450 [Syntrophorhabdaceae bacterium]|nr:hypothetical protein [Syntrophorhabdaceae bacterium]